MSGSPDQAREGQVCLLTGGGDAPGLNAAIRAFYHAAMRLSIRVSVSHFGFDGLLGRADLTELTLHDVRGILPRGGSIIGCSTKDNPLALALAAAPTSTSLPPMPGLLPSTRGLVIAGGDGSLTIARHLGRLGIRCIFIPKTIDGDLPATQQTCGIDTAVETATRAIDALHSTAEAHQRVMIVEVMGRTAGWIAVRAAIAGGADVALIPEIPYDVARVVAKIRERESLGLRFSIIVIGEGARPVGGRESEVEPSAPGRLARLGGAGHALGERLTQLGIGHEVRTTVLGHLQRGGTPTASDRLLASRFGVHAAELCAQDRFGRMVTLRGDEVDSVPLAEVPSSPRTVDPDGALVRCARSLGIDFGG